MLPNFNSPLVWNKLTVLGSIQDDHWNNKYRFTYRLANLCWVLTTQV